MLLLKDSIEDFMTGIDPTTEFEHQLYDRGESQGKMAGFEGSLDLYKVENVIRGVPTERVWPGDSKWTEEGKKIFELSIDFSPQEFNRMDSLGSPEHERMLYELFVVENGTAGGAHLTAPYIRKKESEITRRIIFGTKGNDENIFTGEEMINRTGTPFKPMKTVYTNVCAKGNVWVPGLRITEGGITPVGYMNMLEAEKTNYMNSFYKSGNVNHRHIALALDGALKGFGQY
jgi:hypothetical protein